MVDQEITIDNIVKIPYSYANRTFYQMIYLHVDMMSMNDEKFAYLLGYYSALYTYFSELYTFCIGKFRDFQRVDNKGMINEMRDKRDMMENLMKCAKLQYDSLSRKITVFHDVASRGEV